MAILNKQSTPIFIYCLVLIGAILTAVALNRTVTVINQYADQEVLHNIIIDAGHGGVDGGATSCSGTLESGINLQIALKLNDLLHLMGIKTTMIRTTDISVYTEGESIAAKKISDLKQRVKIVNNTSDAILISIHQNYFSDSRYSGAQVFYSDTADSIELAKDMQKKFILSLNKTSNRKTKKASKVYLMQHINCPGILVECGFLSNPIEELKLKDPVYQRKIACVMASVMNTYLATRNIT